MEFREADGAVFKSTYSIVEDSILYISNNKIVGSIKHHYFKLIDAETLLIKGWWARDISGDFFNIYLKRLNYEN